MDAIFHILSGRARAAGMSPREAGYPLPTCGRPASAAPDVAKGTEAVFRRLLRHRASSDSISATPPRRSIWLRIHDWRVRT